MEARPATKPAQTLTVDPFELLLSHTIGFCSQCIYIARSLTPQQYTYSPEPEVASVGAHIRHLIEYVQCFEEQVRSGVINYNERSRDQSIQNDPFAAMKALEKVQEKVQKLEGKLHGDDTVNVIEAVDMQHPNVEVTSTVERELMFLCNHATHHFALINRIVGSWDNIDMSQLAKAPSTRAHEAA